MTGGTYDSVIVFPEGFTVRDLSAIYDILDDLCGNFDREYDYWDVDGIEVCDLSAEEARAVIAAVESREWDVAPDVSHLREIVEEEEASG